MLKYSIGTLLIIGTYLILNHYGVSVLGIFFGLTATALIDRFFAFAHKVKIEKDIEDGYSIQNALERL